MTWLHYFAAPADFALVLDRLLIDDRRLFEVYSAPGAHPRVFSSNQDAAVLTLGQDPDATGVANHLALWVPAVMPPPITRHIALQGAKYPPGSWREAVEGCGLFWLQTGGLGPTGLTASSLGWFTERAAARQCSVEPGPSSVNWEAHRATARGLRRLIQKELAAAMAGSYPVLPDALHHHRAGMRLVSGQGAKQEFSVTAA